MKLLFEVNTTFSQPIYVSIDESITLNEFHNRLLQQINSFLEESETDIIDVFMENKNSIKSIPNTDTILIDFLNNHPEFFDEHNNSMHRNIHNIFIMDSNHLNNINNKNKENKNIFKRLVTNIKNLLPTIYI